jgi:hypothetical protein
MGSAQGFCCSGDANLDAILAAILFVSMALFFTGVADDDPIEFQLSPLLPGWIDTMLTWTLTWLSITHTSYAAFDINAGHMTMSLGKPFYFYQRYSELLLHCLIGVLFVRPDHAFMGVWHLWKYVDVSAGGLVKKHPRFAHFLDWVDAAAWLYSARYFNTTAAPFVFALCTYAALLQQTWSSRLLGNDSQGSIAYGATLLKMASLPHDKQ